MKSSLEQNKGFVLSIEAILSLIILASALAAISIEPKPSLNREVAYQQAQDIVETCINKGEPRDECFSRVEKINPSLSLNESGEIVFRRKIDGETREITFKLTRVS